MADRFATKEKGQRALRQSVMALHVPVRERAAQFERIVADIRASTDLSGSVSGSSSRCSSQSRSPPDSPRDSRSMSYSWELDLSLRLGLNRSRDSSQQSSSTGTSRSGSSRTNRVVSRSMSSSSVYSDFSLKSFSSDDQMHDDSLSIPDDGKQSSQVYHQDDKESLHHQVVAATSSGHSDSDEGDEPVVPNQRPMKEASLRSAHVVSNEDAIYENINESQRKPINKTAYSKPSEEGTKTTDTSTTDTTYEVYLMGKDAHSQPPDVDMEDYHSNSNHGDEEAQNNNVEEEVFTTTHSSGEMM